MKIIKPRLVDVLLRRFKPDATPALAVGMLKVFPLAIGEAARAQPLPAVWPLVKLALGKAPLDSGLPKARGEFLAYGSAYPPAGFSRQPLLVEVAVGEVRKPLAVFGDREFNLLGVASAPQPFSSLPISQQNAFGGDGFADNPLGKGHAALAAERWPLPNIENPAQLIVHRGDSVAPAGFWAIAPEAPQRSRLLGRFDEHWKASRWPHLPLDTAPDYFQAAPADQRFPGFPRGDEKIVMRHMHPRFPLVESALPGLRARCFVYRQGGVPACAGFSEAPAHAETVWLFPEHDCGLILFRALAPLADEDGDDVAHVFIELENLSEPPLAVAHYWQRFQQKIGLAKPDQSQPPAEVGEPPAEPAAAAEVGEPPAKPAAAPPSPEIQEIEQLSATVGAQLKAMMAQHGLSEADIAKHLPAPLAEEAPMSLAEIEKTIAQVGGQVKQLMAQHGLSEADLVKPVPAAVEESTGGLAELQQLMQQAEQQAQALIKGSGLSEAQLQAVLADRPELAAIADDFMAAPTPGARDKIFAQLAALAPVAVPAVPSKPAAASPPPQAKPAKPAAPARFDRAGVIARHAAGMGMAGCDLSALDLSRLDLCAADFSGALLAGASLAGCRLVGTKFTGAVLQQADFSAAKLDGASFAGASADGAKFLGCSLKNCDASKGDFSGGDFSGADLAQAILDGAVFAGARLAGVQAKACRAQKASFEDCDLSGASFAQARVNGARFNGAKLQQADFSGVSGEKAEFFKVDAKGANFSAANLTASRANASSVFADANFRGATLSRASWAGAVLCRAMLSEALLDKADLSRCQLDGASLLRASAKEARFDKAQLDGADCSGINLFKGSLRLAKLGSVRLQMANLYGVNFYGTAPTATNILGSNIDKTLLSMK